ncbi:hypothetical protein KJ966_02255 [bacterium]|nr:hypothetical protein [bacterium]
MPDRNGTGPRGTGKRNRRDGSIGKRGECRRSNGSGGNRSGSGNRSNSRNQPKNSGIPGSNETVKAIATALFTLVTVAAPVLLKLKNLLTITNQEKAALPEKPESKTVIIEREAQLSDTSQKDKKTD